MPEAEIVPIAPADRRLDRQLMLSLVMALFAAGLEVWIGYMVAHWITLTASKTAGWLVSFCCLALCLGGALLAFNAHRQVAGADDVSPYQGRRLFMARLALSASAFALMVVIAGSLILLTVRPND